MLRIDSQVFCKVCPATSDADHDAVTILANTSYEQLDRLVAPRLDKMVETNVGIVPCFLRGFCSSGRGKRQKRSVVVQIRRPRAAIEKTSSESESFLI